MSKAEITCTGDAAVGDRKSIELRGRIWLILWRPGYSFGFESILKNILVQDRPRETSTIIEEMNMHS